MNEQEQYDYFDRQHNYVDANIRQFIGIYGGKFVLVYEERVVDSDKDEFELAKRAEQRNRFDLKFPVALIKIPRTLEDHLSQKEVEDHLESPEIEFPDFVSPYPAE